LRIGSFTRREGTGHQIENRQTDQSFPNNWESYACGFSGRVVRVDERVLALR
jgi:hypothetical protein